MESMQGTRFLPRVALSFGSPTTLLGRLRASEYVTVGGTRRFRAVQRTRTRAASRVGFLIIAAAAVFDGIVVFDPHLTQSTVLVWLNGGVALMAVLGWIGLSGPLRRNPEPAAFVITLALAFATAMTGTLIPGLAVESIGYLLVIPGLIALILPWQTRTHVSWLIAYAVIALTFLVYETEGGPTTDERGDLIVVALIALIASFIGHVLLQRAQINNFGQVQKIQSLRRRADANMQELARVHETLETTARTDLLTGAANRIRLAEDLRAIRSRLDRQQTAFGLIAVDLDRFKLVNDRYGHIGGDDVLRRVVESMRSALRPADGIYRFGGEEFLVLMETQTTGGLQAAAERLRAAVEAAGIDHPDNVPFGVATISVGATLLLPEDLAHGDDEWFARADGALYRAKGRGRNRVEIAVS
jgi:diguanylate cyclase (GGDEF)-like protein